MRAHRSSVRRHKLEAEALEGEKNSKIWARLAGGIAHDFNNFTDPQSSATSASTEREHSKGLSNITPPDGID